jgi:mannobiose 2-epimerase
MLDFEGHPIDTRKCIYGQAFTVYALAEFLHASGDPEALAMALRLVEKIESTCHDEMHGGYFETYERDWKPAVDQRLSDVDLDEKKSMNTHIHLLEAYAALLHFHEDETVLSRSHHRFQHTSFHLVFRRRVALAVHKDILWPRHRGKLATLQSCSYPWRPGGYGASA